MLAVCRAASRTSRLACRASDPFHRALSVAGLETLTTVVARAPSSSSADSSMRKQLFQRIDLQLRWPQGKRCAATTSETAKTATDGSPDAAAAAAAAPAHCEDVAVRLRKRAGTDLAAAAALGKACASVQEISASLRAAASEEMANTPECHVRVNHEVEQGVAILDGIYELRRERKMLGNERGDLLAVGFQDQAAENREFGALVVCAVAGIFAVSIHYAFFSIFGLSYLLYRNATKAVRRQRAATDDLQQVIDRMKDTEKEEAERWQTMLLLAEAWKLGQPAPVVKEKVQNVAE